MKYQKTVFWTPYEEQKLRKLYPDMRNCDIAFLLGKTQSQVSKRAHQLRLKKSEKFMHSSLSGRMRKRRMPFFLRILKVFTANRAAL